VAVREGTVLSPGVPLEAVEMSDSRQKNKSSNRSSFAGSPLNPNKSIKLDFFIDDFPLGCPSGEHRPRLKAMLDLYASCA
jgi:hypothetical protein